MDVTIRLSGEAAGSDELRSLRTVLLGEVGLHGRLRVVERAPGAGALGPVLEALQIVGGSAGMIGGSAGVSGVMIAWIRNRRSTLTIHVTRSDGAQFKVRSDDARGAIPADVSALADQLSRILDGTEATSDPKGVPGVSGKPGHGGENGDVPDRGKLA
jgi:Effector Associated Constant Component 1